MPTVAYHKLDPAQWVQIARRLAAGESNRSLAAAYGVSRRHIGRIKEAGGKMGRHGERPAKLTRRQRLDVAYFVAVRGLSPARVGETYGVDRGTAAKHGQRHGHELPPGYRPSWTPPSLRDGPPNRGRVRAGIGKGVPKKRAAPAAPAATTPVTVVALADSAAAGYGVVNGRPRCTLTLREATMLATALERRGWRAEACPADYGHGYVEVRDLAVRCHPKVATLRTPEEADAWIAGHGHGLRGRHPVGTTSEHGLTPSRDQLGGAPDWPVKATFSIHASVNPFPE